MNLPVTFLAYALSKKIVNQLRLFLYLKTTCSGHFKLNGQSVALVCEALEFKSDKTFYKNLSWLIQNRWITVNSKSQSYRLVSIDKLCYRLNLKTKTGVEFDVGDFKNFRPFIYATVYAWSIRKKNWVHRQPERKKGRSRKSMSKIPCEMPNRYLAKILDLDHSTISRYKTAASEAGFLSRQHHYSSTDLPEKFMYMLKKNIPEDAHLFVVHKGMVHRQRSDTVTTIIHLKRRRNRPP